MRSTSPPTTEVYWGGVPWETVQSLTMTLSVEVAGDPAAVLQWQTSTDGGTTWTNMAGGKNVTSISRLVRQKNIGNLFRVRAIQKGAAPVFSTVTTLTTPKAVPQD